ncbi:GntR family transcriptional regulator [Pseudomaricurvus alkylphenolicus]|jgi:GntR family transcriptional regulator|uniref:GntR family transcriptional regulator n=1 Tax=Pseudomaricurvus alkylphenolicus TaxID=1306991 RepID=UPI0014211D49|nr:GntR family transcriptional regulator [Pseudomaricurvus alkylphenolicus]NIB42363.1 GntR family transcriptional regulator [Pseudomaricurvus alkylphenolicus]
MQENWKDDQPIYRQLRDRVAALIMEGAYPEGQAIPSVRQVSGEFRINHLTVSKAYQELVDQGLVEKRRGLGMFVIPGAKDMIRELERNKFLNAELPEFVIRMRKLGIDKEELIKLLEQLDGGALDE